MTPLKKLIKALENRSYIVESGSNDNGSWIKYSDGTMICRITISKENFLQTETFSNTAQGIVIYRSKISTWEFPISFISTDIQLNVGVYTSTNGTRVTIPRFHNLTKTKVDIQLLGLEDFLEDKLGYINLTEVFITAIGKWK